MVPGKAEEGGLKMKKTEIEKVTSTEQFRKIGTRAESTRFFGPEYELASCTRQEAEKLYNSGDIFFWSETEEDVFPDGWNCSFIWGTERASTKVLTDPFDGSRTVYTAKPFGEETSRAVRFWKEA